MKKLAIFSLLALALSVASARPPVEGDVLDANNFVLGVDISGAIANRVGGTSVPYLYGSSNINGQRIPISSHTLAENAKQTNFMANVNFRYGLFDYFEFFANGNGYYQFVSPKGESDMTKKMNFANANIGLMATLYKGDSFRLVIGDNSDVLSNIAFDNSDTHMSYFKGHTFFLNAISRMESENMLFSTTAQLYYRLNMTQSYNDTRLKNGDEWGVNALIQLASGNSLGYLGLTIAQKDSDVLNGTHLGGSFGGFGAGGTIGAKYDLNNHLGLKISVDYMVYSIAYNSSYANLTLGIYFK